MALRTTIDLESPDRTDTTKDITNTPRGTYTTTPFSFTLRGVLRIETTHVVKTWIANTKAACDTAAAAYEGNGSIRITEAHPVIKAYTLEISEDSGPVATWIPVEEE